MLKETRIAIAARLQDHFGDEIQVSPTMLADPTPPAAHVYPTPVEYDETMGRGSDDWSFTVQVFVSDAGGDEGAQELLDEYIEPFGPRSVKEALELADTDDGRVSLGGVIFDLRVERCEGYRLYVREGRAPVLGSEWTLDVTAPGKED